MSWLYISGRYEEQLGQLQAQSFNLEQQNYGLQTVKDTNTCVREDVRFYWRYVLCLGFFKCIDVRNGVLFGEVI